MCFFQTPWNSSSFLLVSLSGGHREVPVCLQLKTLDIQDFDWNTVGKKQKWFQQILLRSSPPDVIQLQVKKGYRLQKSPVSGSYAWRWMQMGVVKKRPVWAACRMRWLVTLCSTVVGRGSGFKCLEILESKYIVKFSPCWQNTSQETMQESKGLFWLTEWMQSIMAEKAWWQELFTLCISSSQEAERDESHLLSLIFLFHLGYPAPQDSATHV